MRIDTTNDVEVRLLETMGTDRDLARAAMVSTRRDENDISQAKLAGLLSYLMKSRHGTPFEQAALRFYVAAPIFVFREFHRHRIGFSYNEMSGRYTELEALFYLPGKDRPMVNTGTSARPVLTAAAPELTTWFNEEMLGLYIHAWEVYQAALERGVAKEVARIGLPVGIFTRMHVTCNPRSLMSFLSLRTHDALAQYPSHPQYEIELVARQMETYFAHRFPVTHAAFNAARRVAP